MQFPTDVARRNQFLVFMFDYNDEDVSVVGWYVSCQKCHYGMYGMAWHGKDS